MPNGADVADIVNSLKRLMKILILALFKAAFAKSPYRDFKAY